ncbi:MAG: hypothetical protein ABW217_17120 [Polyangiaceae bacterium]
MIVEERPNRRFQSVLHPSRALLGLVLCVIPSACGGLDETAEELVASDEAASEAPRLGTLASALTAPERLSACRQDPRVVTGLVTAEVCAGARLFFDETFAGNGRTCGSCHPAANNFALDASFVSSLPASDPLFVFERDAQLATLETRFLRESAGILENVDGFEDLTNKFVVRSVPHMLSLATSITPDLADGTTRPPVQRVGWSGDGPGDGSLRQFFTAAVNQHFPRDLSRTPGVSFRSPSAQELDLALAFQLSLGRNNELDLAQVNLFDADANEGKRAFIDPNRGRCNECHANAGANSLVTGRNKNFDTGTGRAPIFGDVPAPFDGGFGGQGLAEPNFDTFGRGVLDAFGDGTFSTPSLIESADTAPFFHTNAFFPIEAAVGFYAGPQFLASPAGRELEAKFGSPVQFGSDDLTRIARFLRVLNAAFNLDIAKQRLRAAQTILTRFQNQQLAIQQGLLRLASVEIDDALEVLTDTPVVPVLHPEAQERLGLAKSEISAALAASVASQRSARIANAISRVENARDHFGSNITYRLGQGNLMF